MAVFVLDKRKKPLMPCSEKRARILLERGRAVVHKKTPFTIRLRDRTREESTLQPLRLKIDPGSRRTGLALVREDGADQHVLWLGEIEHRSSQISRSLQQRAGFRRRRRSANLRYRAPRFLNRTRPEEWLAPSLRHRVDSTASWVDRLSRWSPVSGVAVEVARFDPQALENPEVSGKEYQQGELYDTERWEYLLGKWHRRCAYCDADGVPLEKDHIVPRSRNGSDRISNLTLACRPCNQAKDNLPIETYLADDPTRAEKILRDAGSTASLRDAAALNSTRYALLRRLKATGLSVESATGGRTKYNRKRLSVPKTHALDAACVGDFGRLFGWRRPTLQIAAMGRGAYKRTRLTPFGFPRGTLMRRKQVHGFQTGDHARAEVPAGVHAGIHVGRVAVRATGSFNIRTRDGVRQGIHHRFCRLLQRADGYGYALTSTRERATG